MTLASAPSIPATTTTASAAVTSSRWASRRCRPATPTSSRRSGRKPSAVSVTSHSSATGCVGRPGRHDEHASRAGDRRRPVQQRAAVVPGRAVLGEHRLHLVVGGPREQHGSGAVGEQLADDAHALLGRLARPVDGLGHALAQLAVVIDERAADVGERQPAQAADDVVGAAPAGRQVVEQRPQRRFVHRPMLPEHRGAIRQRLGGQDAQ